MRHRKEHKETNVRLVIDLSELSMDSMHVGRLILNRVVTIDGVRLDEVY